MSTFKIKAFNSQGTIPSYDDKRISIEGWFETECPKCSKALKIDGTNILYFPDTYTTRHVWCEECDHEQDYLEIVDIRDGYVEFRRLPEFAPVLKHYQNVPKLTGEY